MIYWLFNNFNWDIPGHNLMNYISFRAGVSFALALVVALLFGHDIIRRLQRMQIGEEVRNLGLEGQVQKKGTPTMGGIIIIMATLIPCLLMGNLGNIYLLLMIVATLWMGAIGFLDDYRKLKFHNKEGLRGKYKVLGQIGLGAVVGVTMWLSPDIVMSENFETRSVNPDAVTEVIVSTEQIKSPQTTIPFVKNNNFNYEWLTSWISDENAAQTLGWLVFVLVVILFFKHWTTGFLSSSSILIGIVAGYIAAFIMGFVLPTTGVTADGVEFTKAWVLNWDKVAQASWFAIPKLVPVKIVFDMRAILPVLIMFIVTAVETVGDISGVMEGGMGREATDKELSGGVICDGLGSSFAACFGVLPNTSFSQNVGLVAMTKVVNRGALATGAIFLILCGLIPKLGALVSIMPQAVLGGAAVMMFSSIVVSGIQLITKEKMTPRTLTIVSVALGVGYGMGANASILAKTPQLFQLICGESGIVPAAFVAIVLNVLLPKDAE